MLYAIVLTVHSWWRWVVVMLALVVLVRAVRGMRAGAAWSATDAKLAGAFVGSVDLQFTLGIAMLFFLSPITTTALKNLAEAMKDPQLRFFTVEHATTMIPAVAAAHLGLVMARKAATTPKAHRRIAIAAGVFVFLVAVGIPWPWVSYGRPLFRF